MVISVLERRTEIGLRRALGATKGQIRGQFLIEALQLAALGGLAGVFIGAATTVGYAGVQHDTATDLRDSVGSSRAARMAGSRPAMPPTTTAAPNPPVTAMAGIIAACSKDGVRTRGSPANRTPNRSAAPIS
jgi:putative ABC transport system permease protein